MKKNRYIIRDGYTFLTDEIGAKDWMIDQYIWDTHLSIFLDVDGIEIVGIQTEYPTLYKQDSIGKTLWKNNFKNLITAMENMNEAENSYANEILKYYKKE